MAATLTEIPYTPSVSFGGDPEFFLVNEEGKAVPAEEVLPAQEEVSYDKEPAYRDGFQVELGLAPSACRAYVIDSMTRAARKAHHAAKEKGYRLHVEAAIDVTPDVLENTKDPRSREFGCEPDLLAHEGARPNIVELDASIHPFRYAGGHIHLGSNWSGHTPSSFEEWSYGWALHHPLGQIELIKMADTLLGNTLVLLERDTDRKRREVYGRAGTFRITRYGVEYRVPSNLIYRHPAMLNLAFSLLRTALGVVSNGEAVAKHFMLPPEDVAGAINEGDRIQAYKNFMKIKENLYAMTGHTTREDLYGTGLAALEFMMRVGFDNVFTKSFEDAWYLDSTISPIHGSLGKTWREEHPVLLRPFKEWYEFRDRYNPAQAYL